MATVCLPAIVLPEHVVTQEELLEITPQVYSDHRRLKTILRIIKNSGVKKRHFVQPPAQIVHHPGFEERNGRYIHEAKNLGILATEQALANAGLRAEEIDMIVVTSCTGFMIPSLDAHLINKMGFRTDVTRLPIAQLGCSAGAAAIGRAVDYCRAYPEANILIVAAEFCSLCFQPNDLSLPAIVSAMIFGDGVAACVVRGRDATGFDVGASGIHFLRNTQHFMGFEVKDTGFHIVLDKAVPGAVHSELVPAFEGFVRKHGFELNQFDFYLFHPGGARVLDNLVKSIGVDELEVVASRECLAEVGNLSSASVFVVLKNTFERHRPAHGDTGFLAAFGPGFCTEMSLGTWVEN